VNAPPSTVHLAQLITQNILTGPLGDDDPTRPLLTTQPVPANVLNAALHGDGMVPAFRTMDTTKQLFAVACVDIPRRAAPRRRQRRRGLDTDGIGDASATGLSSVTSGRRDSGHHLLERRSPGRHSSTS
jgi:hypothetical protein